MRANSCRCQAAWARSRPSIGRTRVTLGRIKRASRGKLACLATLFDRPLCGEIEPSLDLTPAGAPRDPRLDSVASRLVELGPTMANTAPIIGAKSTRCRPNLSRCWQRLVNVGLTSTAAKPTSHVVGDYVEGTARGWRFVACIPNGPAQPSMQPRLLSTAV